MIESLLEPFTYNYMTNAILVCALVGGTCAFLSAYLILKGWALMGDALAHSIVPGVALAYILNIPYAIGAFFAGIFAASSIVFIKKVTHLREDTIIGLVFTSLFAFGLLLISLKPTSVNLNAVILGNILAVSDSDIIQLVLICTTCLILLILKWRDFMAVFFDENHARAIALPVGLLKILFFAILSAATVSALQTVGACLVIAIVITPGATAYLLTERFHIMILLSVTIGTITSALGAYSSYFLNTNPGGLIVTLQTLIFIVIFIFAPKHGTIARRRALKRQSHDTTGLAQGKDEANNNKLDQTNVDKLKDISVDEKIIISSKTRTPA